MGSMATKATVKGHGYTVGDRVNFHGMGNDSIPATDPTLCVLGKEGAKYTLTSVEPNHLGKPWVWTFGAAASFWASPAEKVEITEHVSDGITLYSGECAHGWTTGLYADRDDAIAVAAGHGEVSRPLYVAPETPELDVFAEAMAEAILEEVEVPESLPPHFTEVCQMCQEAPRTHEVRTDGSFIGSMSTPSRPVFHVCAACHGKIMATAESTASGWPNVVAVWVEDSPNGVYPYRVTWVEPACRMFLALTLEDAQEIRRRVSPGYHRDINAYLVIAEPEVPATAEDAIPTNTPDIPGYYWKRYVIPGDSVTALSTYQLIADGSNGCQVAATVKYVKDGMWQATGCVWVSTGLTEGYWQGESLADAFAHVVQYMAWVSSVLGVGLNWAEISRMDWRTPYVAPQVAGATVDPTSEATADVLIKPEGHAPDHVMEYGTDWTFCQTCGRYVVHTLKFSKPLSAPVRSKLAKRARKAAKRHAFAGKR